jgi:hypothetical protein
MRCIVCGGPTTTDQECLVPWRYAKMQGWQAHRSCWEDGRPPSGYSPKKRPGLVRRLLGAIW